MFHSEVFAIAVYPAAGNSFLMRTQTQFNVSKMYLPFHFEWHLKNPHIFRMLGFICQYCRMDWSRWQNCESSQVSWGYVESSGGMAQTDTQNYSEFLPWRRSGNFFFCFHPIHSTHSVILNLHLKKKLWLDCFYLGWTRQRSCWDFRRDDSRDVLSKALELHYQENFWFWWTVIFLYVIM